MNKPHSCYFCEHWGTWDKECDECRQGSKYEQNKDVTKFEPKHKLPLDDVVAEMMHICEKGGYACEIMRVPGFTGDVITIRIH